MIQTFVNFDLSRVTTFAIHAKCERYVEYDSAGDIPEILSTLSPGEKFVNIGGGSNMLFTGNYPGVVAHGLIKGIEIISETDNDVFVKVRSGVKMDDFIVWACENDFWGVENLSGIPGEAGASAVQNVGAYGAEAGDAIAEVYVYDRVRKGFAVISGEDCRFAYRDSLFKHEPAKSRYIIHSVVYSLSKLSKPVLDYPALQDAFPVPPENPRQVREAVIKIRGNKLPDPDLVPSAGSFFKNPIVSDAQLQYIIGVVGNESFPHFPTEDGWKIPAAWLIDQCGWKGYREGNVGVWHLQPLVLINPERKANADEILQLEHKIAQSVKNRYGVALTPEVEHL